MQSVLKKITTTVALTTLVACSSLVFAGSGGECGHDKKSSKGEQKAMMEGQSLSEEAATALVKPFYELLSGETTAEAARANFAPDWKSYSGRESYRGLDDTLGFAGGPLQKMVPDLNWEMVDVSVTGDNTIVVRGEATGTPVGETFMGQPVTGKGFKMMSIDLHTVKDGKVVATYHVEDWRGAFAQMAAK